MNHVYKADIGTVIELNTGVVLTGMSGLYIEVKKPSGALASWTGAIGVDTKSVEHTITSGELDESGDYILQAKATLGVSVWHGDPVMLAVKDLFK